MTYTMPLRRTIRHLAHRFFTDGDTFIENLLDSSTSGQFPRRALAKRPIIQVLSYSVQPTVLFQTSHGTVRMRGSPSVTATECSKWAVSDLSAEMTVHSSRLTRVS